jgi:hypothetical protein
VVRLQAMPLGNFIYQRAWLKTFRNDLCLDVIRPMPLRLTPRLLGWENLLCNLHGETPVARR